MIVYKIFESNARSSNGRTRDFESRYEGSIPSLATMKLNYRAWILIALGAFIFALAGFLLGRYFNLHWIQQSEEVTYDNPPLRSKESRYKFISPLYACGTLGHEKFQEFIPLKNKIQKIIDDQLYAKAASAISVYFRDLNRGRRFAINDAEHYFPASLSKVPMMITYFKLAESNPQILDETILYDGSFNANAKEDIKPKNAIKPGSYYTVDELISAMILHSDNNATRLLFNRIEPTLLSEVFSDLNIPAPKDTKLDVMTVKLYSYFFRVLYNATYLSQLMSDKALKLLTQADFQSGLRANVPSDVPIAEKYGESTIYSNESKIYSRELHDCGIIYQKTSPYLLCIMTKGDNFENLTQVIQNISKTTYQEVVDASYQN